MTTTLNGFSIDILGDYITHFRKSEYNYYSLPHLCEYRIKLTNNRSTRCNAEVFIDGESVGTWRIDSFDNIIIERPANINRRFIFVEERSSIATQAGIYQNKHDNGLISVVFEPEKPNDSFYSAGSYSPLYNSFSNYNSTLQSNQSFNCISSAGTRNITEPSYDAGATILGAGTDQYFNTADQLTDIDSSNITTINLRLVASKKNKPYISIKDAMRTNYNPVPPRINHMHY